MSKIAGEGAESRPVWETLEAFARTRMQELLQELLIQEANELLGRAKSERRAPGTPRVYRNGFGKERKLGTSMGTISVRRPRARGLEERFESRILPLFKRRTEEVGRLLPELYLHGLAMGDFELALRGLLGEGAPLSSASISRLRSDWEVQYQSWRERSLAELDIVYCWADGLYVKAGLEAGKAALLVIIGATSTGEKAVLAVESGQRESTESWAAVLRDLKRRGMNAPRAVVADAHLGIWSALAQIYPEVAEQRCWNHKMINVLDQVPLKKQGPIKQWLRKMMNAETREKCEEHRDKCIKQYKRLYPKAMAALERDWERMVTFFDFPGALDSPPHHQRGGVPLRCRTASYERGQALQAHGERDGAHLEAAHGRGEDVSTPECTAPTGRCCRWCEVRERKARHASAERAAA